MKIARAQSGITPNPIEGALQILLILADMNHAESNESKELLLLLDGLPLAIAQAAAFLRETGSIVSKYLELYTKEWKDLMNDTSLRSYSNGSIQTTWMVSYEAIKKRNEVAANLI
jgi:hypothetical protein